MQSCDDCPGSVKCAGLNLHPILVQVYDLYVGGMRDKFEILFALGEKGEAVIERYDNQVSHACWTKAALMAIVDVVGRVAHEKVSADLAELRVFETVRTARDAFESFPWKFDALVEQAPDLYALIQEQCPDPGMCERMSKRGFIKVCKKISKDR